MKKKITCVILTALLVLGLTACGTKGNDKVSGSDSSLVNGNNEATTGEDNSLQYIKDRGKFILGLDDKFPPMGFRNDNDEIVGFDIDLAQAVCDKLGVELVVQTVEWDAKEMELSTKNIDCIWNGFSITDERKEALTMTEPYLENTISMVVRKDSDVKSMADLAGKNIALQAGSAAEETLDADSNKEFKDSLGEIKQFSDYATALMDLETKNSDAVLMDSVVAKYMIGELGKDFVVLDEALAADEYGIGFRKGDQALADAVSNALSELKAEGKVKEIAEKWFGEDITKIQ
ncbi:amino acid ABC transporter substrate-binding protein [Clostridium sp. Marseille-P299]|uniref:amino acid ABC transporter substrate-binding protein n=1 Tax=Clostridium sp. Marseille-P299 TaxID=1805477 RepID=UPI0008379E60|nr:amino acid ABC transporter substrate-binding protein [Clostridium sp. Marseille-P299]